VRAARSGSLNVLFLPKIQLLLEGREGEVGFPRKLTFELVLEDGLEFFDLHEGGVLGAGSDGLVEVGDVAGQLLVPLCWT
jgi:hypothetical protein